MAFHRVAHLDLERPLGRGHLGKSSSEGFEVMFHAVQGDGANRAAPNPV